jgi:serine protease Do
VSFQSVKNLTKEALQIHFDSVSQLSRLQCSIIAVLKFIHELNDLSVMHSFTCRFNAVVTLTAIFVGIGFHSPPALAQESGERGKVYGLLVGVTKYPDLKNSDLRGPARDVILMEDTLKRFDAKVTTLSEAGDDSHLPTSKNIEREFKRLATLVKPGDQVAILLAGHGSQNANDNPETDPETDGLDEVFLARDTKKESNRYVNAISDDQLDQWLTSIRTAGASVMFVSDSCHSDTQTRGENQSPDGQSDTRGLPTLAGDVSKLRQDNGKAESGGSSVDIREKSGSLVAYFAAQGNQETPDEFLAPGASKKEPMGLLTYTVCKILNKYPGITYRELGQRIKQQYVYYQRRISVQNIPDPASSGIDLDRVVLGNEWKAGRSQYVFEVKGDFEVSGGAIDGITSGSILKMMPLAGDGDEILVWAVVDRVNARDCRCSAVDYDPATGRWNKRLKTPKTLSRGRCEIVSVQYAGQKLQVFLDPAIPDYLSDELKRRFTALIETFKIESTKATSPFELVSASKAEFLLGLSLTRDLNEGELARLLLRIRNERRPLTPAAVFNFGALNDNSMQRILTNLKYISRSKRLVNLALESSGNHSIGGIRTTLTAEIADQANGPYTEVDLDQEEILAGKFIRFRIRNYSPRTVKVTLLYMGDDFKILPLLPSMADTVDEVSPMRDKVPGEKILNIGAQLKIASRMRESIVAIVTAKEPGIENSDYTHLKQDPLDAIWMVGTRERGATASADSVRKRGEDSPLKYLSEIGFEPTRTRSMEFGSVPDHAFNVLTFQTVNPKPDKQPFDLDALTKRISRDSWQPKVAEPNGRGLGKSIFPKVAPSVVVVRTQNGHGTGFLISDDGWLVTNHHVAVDSQVEEGSGFRIANIHLGKLNESGFMELQEQPLIADVYKWDSDKDLALLKIRRPSNENKFSYLRLAENPVGPGSDCVAIGHPAAGSLWQLRSGEVQGASIWPGGQIDAVMSRLSIGNRERKQLEEWLKVQPQVKILISSCGMNPGDSGGPLVDKEGRVIGVSFAGPAMDLDRMISLDKFTYHVNLSELQKFIEEKPTAPLLEPPTIWQEFADFDLTTLSNSKRIDTLVLTTASEDELVFLVDIDGDTPTASYQGFVSINNLRQSWDFEVAFRMSVDGLVKECSYDTDNDGTIDYVHQRNFGGEGDVVWNYDGTKSNWMRNAKGTSSLGFSVKPLKEKFDTKSKRIFHQCRVSIKAIINELD